jgi:hypothetical protein
MGTPGRPAHVSIPVRGGLDGLGVRGDDGAASASAAARGAGITSGSGRLEGDSPRGAEGGGSGGEKVAGAPTSSVGAGSDLGAGVDRTVDGRDVMRGELGRASGALGGDETAPEVLAGAASDGALETDADSTRGDEAGTDNGEGAACDGRALGMSEGSDGPSPVSGRPTARRLTTVGRIRSSTIEELFCFSRCRRTRSTNSGSTELMWLRTSPKPIDWTRATSTFCSMPSSFATS